MKERVSFNDMQGNYGGTSWMDFRINCRRRSLGLEDRGCSRQEGMPENADAGLAMLEIKGKERRVPTEIRVRVE